MKSRSFAVDIRRLYKDGSCPSRKLKASQEHQTSTVFVATFGEHSEEKKNYCSR